MIASARLGSSETSLCCSSCGRQYPVATREWRCDCGGAFKLEGVVGFSPEAVRSDEFTLWRYGTTLPVRDEVHVISLGEGFTPLVETEVYDRTILCKPEFMNPTGSFKDRGGDGLGQHSAGIGRDQGRGRLLG